MCAALHLYIVTLAMEFSAIKTVCQWDIMGKPAFCICEQQKSRSARHLQSLISAFVFHAWIG